MPGKAHRETQWRDHTVIPYARLKGWHVYWVWRSDHSPKGWPDLVLIRPPRVLFRELKTDRGVVTVEQLFCMSLLRECGADVGVWRPAQWEQICEELE